MNETGTGKDRSFIIPRGRSARWARYLTYLRIIREVSDANKYSNVTEHVHIYQRVLISLKTGKLSI